MISGLGLNFLFGPPGFSGDFLDEYKDEVDAYIEITKSPEYKLWNENPERHPPDDALSASIAFVDEFQSNPAFQSELTRRARYESSTDWFNFAMLLILVVGLSRKPVARLVKRMVTAERERIEDVENKRAAAARRKLKAEQKLEKIAEERAKADLQVAQRIAQETQLVQSSTADALLLVSQELEDRKKQAQYEARQRLKAMMADEAVRILEQRFREQGSAAQDEALIDQFLADLGAQK